MDRDGPAIGHRPRTAGGGDASRRREIDMSRRTVYVIAALMGVVITALLHASVTGVRGYEAVGGEFLFLSLPLWVWVVECLVDRR